MQTVIQDVRTATRSLWRRPSFAVVVVLTLALGIGANTAIFTLINGLILRPLPVRNPEELVIVGRGISCCMNTGIQRNFDLWSYRLYHDVLDRSQDYFSGFAAVSSMPVPVQVREPGTKDTARAVWSRVVSANYFSVVGAEPSLGRGFRPEEDGAPAAHPVAVISYRYWQNQFAGTPSTIGKTLIVNGTVFTIVGVAPRAFFGETVEMDPADIWVPLAMQTQIAVGRDVLSRPDVYWLYTFGRLKPGVTPEQVSNWLKPQVEQYMLAFTSGLTEKDKSNIQKVQVPVTPGFNGFSPMRRAFRDPLIMLMSIVALLLIICCSNIANLLLSRSAARQKEIATRVALGASRGRLVRQLLTESVVIGVIGGALGLLFGYAGTRAIVAMRFSNTEYVPLALFPDLRVFGFTFGIAVFTSLLFGIAPAIAASRMDIMARIRGVTDSPASRKLNLGKLLVVAQVAMSLTMVVSAGLLARSLAQLQRQDFGFSPSVIDVNFDSQKAGYKYEQLEPLYRTLTDRISALPGVESASYAQYTPFNGNNWNSSIVIPGRRSDDSNLVTRWTRIGPEFFSTMGMKTVAGRSIEVRDTSDSTKVAVVSQSFANKFFPGEDAIGKHFSFDDDGRDALEIVGVVQDVKFQSAREEVSPTAFLPMFQMPRSTESAALYMESAFAHDLVVRVKGDPLAVGQEIRKTLLDINPDLPIRSVRTMQQQVQGTMAQDVVVQRLATWFGLLGLLIASVGIYGLMMYSVVRRSRELGIRFAVGATRQNVVLMVLGESMLLVIMGIVIGIPLTWGATRLAANLLYGIAPYDPRVAIESLLTLTGVAAFAAYIPAHRAARVDPLLVLKAE
jgi:predicted permease